MTQDNKPTESKEENKKPNDHTGVMMTGHIKIFDPETGEVIVDKRNAIHYENMSISLAESIGNGGTGWIYEMSFGNGGTSVDPTGIITYLTQIALELTLVCITKLTAKLLMIDQ